MSEHIEATLGDEQIIREDALQPFAHQAANGDILLGCYSPIDDEQRQRNRFPGQSHWLVSKDNGETWEPSKFSPKEPGVGLISTSGRIDEKRTLLLNVYAWRDETDDEGKGPFTTHRWIANGSFDEIEGPLDTVVNVPDAVANHSDEGHAVDLIVLHRQIAAMPDGRLLTTAYCRFIGDNTPSAYRKSMVRTRVVLLESSDMGATWDYKTTVAADPSVGQEGFNEAALMRISRGPDEGKLLCRMRTGSAGSPIYECSSRDDGETWTRPFASEACGVDPCLIELSDGRLATSYGTRMWDNGGGQNNSPLLTPTNKVAISSDQGQSWQVIADVPMRSPETNIDTTTNYTTVVEIGEGKLLLFYDIGLFFDEKRYLATRIIEIQPDE